MCWYVYGLIESCSSEVSSYLYGMDVCNSLAQLTAICLSYRTSLSHQVMFTVCCPTAGDCFPARSIVISLFGTDIDE